MKEQDETLAVLDAWGDSYGRQGARGYGWWIVVALIAAGGLLGTMAAFPNAVHWLTSF